MQRIIIERWACAQLPASREHAHALAHARKRVAMKSQRIEILATPCAHAALLLARCASQRANGPVMGQ
jgi:hypothetical protein